MDNIYTATTAAATTTADTSTNLFFGLEWPPLMQQPFSINQEQILDESVFVRTDMENAFSLIEQNDVVIDPDLLTFEKKVQ